MAARPKEADMSDFNVPVSFDLAARGVAVESVLNDRALTEAIRRAGHEVTAYA